MPHWWALIAAVEIALYDGDAVSAWNIVDSQWRALERSLLMRAQYIHIESLFHRARAALALVAASGHTQRRLLRSAMTDASAIEREKAHWGVPVAVLIRASAAAVEGRTEAALRQFESAENGFREADMHLFAAAARRRRGVLIGGDRGQTLVNEADGWMQAQDIQNSQRMTAMLVPG